MSGWNRSTGVVKPSPQKKPGIMRGAIAGLAVVAVLGLAAFFIFGGKDAKPKVEKVEKKPSQLAEVKPAAAKEVESVAIEEDPSVAARKARAAKFKAMTPDERLNFLREEARKRPLPQSPSSNRIFRTALEQAMGWVFTCEVGDMPPPLPKMTMFDEEHLAEILIMDNPILDTDSEIAKENKTAVQLAKKEFISFIKQGGDPSDFLPYYHGQLVQAYEESKMARKTIIETLKSDPDIAPEFIKKVNDGLEAKGIKKIVLPKRMLEKYGVQLEE